MAILGLTGHAKTSKNIGVFNMDDDVNKAFWAGLAFGAMLSAIPMIFLGGLMARSDLREAAIKAKVAEYDSQTGQFKYKILEGEGKDKEAK